MTRIALVFITVSATACIDDGKAGAPGEPGQAGPVGPPGQGLVWKDLGGAVVENAYTAFHDHTFSMIVKNSDGVFFDISSLAGLPSYASVTTTSGRMYATNNCTGPVHISIAVAPGVAFKLDGRVVALPTDVEVVASAASYYSGSYCYAGTYAGDWIKLPTLEALPTLTPPLLGVGPYHVEPM